jgi:hypothetical protein
VHLNNICGDVKEMYWKKNTQPQCIHSKSIKISGILGCSSLEMIEISLSSCLLDFSVVCATILTANFMQKLVGEHKQQTNGKKEEDELVPVYRLFHARPTSLCHKIPCPGSSPNDTGQHTPLVQIK